MRASRPTVKDIAREARVSLSTVSYALRNSKRISQKTRDRIQKVAASMGYRRNPYISALMAEIGRGRKIRSVENLALIWPQGSRDYCHSEGFCRQIVNGVRARASILGYDVCQFWMEEDKISGKRLSSILFTRNIRGIIFAPAFFSASLSIEMDWDRFATVALGHAQWNPEMHRAMPNHYLAVRECILRLEQKGCKRLAAVFSEDINTRTDLSQEASFLTHHPQRRDARGLIYLAKESNLEHIPQWLRSAKADGVLFGRHEILDTCMKMDPNLFRSCIPVTLDWMRSKQNVSGILFRYDLVASSAVDLLAAQLQANETGIPRHPHILMMRGDWRDA